MSSSLNTVQGENIKITKKLPLVWNLKPKFYSISNDVTIQYCIIRYSIWVVIRQRIVSDHDPLVEQLFNPFQTLILRWYQKKNGIIFSSFSDQFFKNPLFCDDDQLARYLWPSIVNSIKEYIHIDDFKSSEPIYGP